ncbi:MAG: transcriptional repressor [Syntrophus sp. (in: bacteria)]|nr:transcriptional repressor [Syntrophus sp. (in: bacteria)]
MLKLDRRIDIKLTPQRLAILECLVGNTSHPSASDIYKSVFEKFPTMSFATVYNTLETLKEKGVVVELSIDPDKKRFDPNTIPHHHLLCLRCKIIKDIFEKFSLVLSESEEYNFDIIGNHVDFYGICPQCKGVESNKHK